MREDIIPAIPNIRSHLVLLGAGASRAAFPDGDANGRPLPLMADLVSVLGLESLLRSAGVADPTSDFELIYSMLFDTGNQAALAAIENIVWEYFSELQLPSEPCLYDHLVLSLRKKDVVATFNWDPLLVQAWNRCHNLTADLPILIALHGNVALRVCDRHELLRLEPGLMICRKCGSPTQPSRLLYPVAHKDYSDGREITTAWADMGTALRSAFVFTIFGYAAPQSDAEAKELMSAAWGKASTRELEEIEFINIQSAEELTANWADFICGSHQTPKRLFLESIAGQYPRRGAEHIWNLKMEGHLRKPYRSPVGLGWHELAEWLKPLLDDEERRAADPASKL